MTEGSEPVRAGLAQSRDRIIDVLSEQFARDALTLEEFERRVDLAHRATTHMELARLLDDLPPLPAPAAGAAPAVRPGPGVVLPERVRGRQVLVAVFGGASRRGRWIPARHLMLYAFCGGGDLDFRDAQFGPGVTEVTVVALMGGATIVVPPGLPVECGGVAIMGGFDQMEEAAPPDAPDAPRLKINGFVLMGGVEVDVRLPGETKSEAKRRRRQERKRLRGG